MTISLTTHLTPDGQRLTFEDGTAAGNVNYSPSSRTFQFLPPIRNAVGPHRKHLTSAQYDALAWAEDQQP